MGNGRPDPLVVLAIPLNRQPAVADTMVSLPVGDRMAQQVMSLPMHPYLSVPEQAKIVTTLK